MESKGSMTYNVEGKFDLFLEALRQKKKQEWDWLIDHFRDRALPWLYTKVEKLPSTAIVTRQDFVEEVFAKSLFRFYELFTNGDFEVLGDLRGLFFRIAELKLKEGYYQLKRDQRIYFTDTIKTDITSSPEPNMEEILEKREAVQMIEQQLSRMPETDRDLLLRYADGEKLKDIANEMGIDETSLRMRKYRAMKKLKSLVKKVWT